MSQGWVGVDLDGTLAHYIAFEGPTSIGDPIPAMVDRVKRWLAMGQDVRIFTARISDGELATRTAIVEWCVKHIGQALPVTNVKDYAMVELWDDRCVQVIPNTGEPVGQSTRGLI